MMTVVPAVAVDAIVNVMVAPLDNAEPKVRTLPPVVAEHPESALSAVVSWIEGVTVIVPPELRAVVGLKVMVRAPGYSAVARDSVRTTSRVAGTSVRTTTRTW